MELFLTKAEGLLTGLPNAARPENQNKSTNARRPLPHKLLIEYRGKLENINFEGQGDRAETKLAGAQLKMTVNRLCAG